MFPILLEIFGYKIYSYGFFIALGYVSGMALGCFLARSRGLETGPYLDVGFIAIVTGVLGARLLYVITSPEQFLANPKELFDFWNGGLVFYGGFLLAFACCTFFGWKKKLPLWLSLDFGGIVIAWAHAFGRIGCFAAGCCHGRVCPYPWGVALHSDFVKPELRSQPLHPVQLYEALLLFLLAGILFHIVFRRKLREGSAFLIYVAGYGAIRFFTELFRGDDDRGSLAWFSTSQAIGLALLLGGSGVLIGRLRGKNL